ncbi:MAG: PfkB family carbohydrate kinase [Chloroflexota bacterium]|nr:PfkB family carbohydrate kinase [Chloroflexota bacterium]
MPWRLGGSAFYAAAAAARLGARTALATRVGPAERDALAAACDELGIHLVPLPAAVTTTFAFRAAADGRRELRLRSRARAIALQDIPPAVRETRAVIFASVAHELDPSLFSGFPRAVRVVEVQGYLRDWDADGTVRPRRWSAPAELLAAADAIVVSEEDLGGDEGAVSEWARSAPVVVTRAERGSRTHRADAVHDAEALPVDAVVDVTGAGDAFSAGLALALADKRPLADAVRFAHAVASFAVEGVGPSALADRPAVDRRLSAGTLGS